MDNQKGRFYTYAVAAVLLIVAIVIKWLNPEMEWAAVTGEIATYVGLATTVLAMVKSNPKNYDVVPAHTPDNVL